MGEKEQGTASNEDEGAGATERASNLNLSKSNIDRITGDPDFDMARASSVKSSKSNTSDREGAPGGSAGAGIAIDEPGVQ